MSNFINLTSNSPSVSRTSDNDGAPGPSRRRSRSRSRNTAAAGGAGPSRPRSRSGSVNSTFTDIITFERTPRSRGIMLNTKMYDVNALAQMVISNMRGRRVSRVPHSRTELTSAQVDEIRRRTSVPWPAPQQPAAAQGRQRMAAAIPLRQGVPAQPAGDVPPLYLRRHLPAGGYRFYMIQKITGRPSVRVHILRTAGVWELIDLEQHSRLDTWPWHVLTNVRAAVDYSQDFALPDQGHWVRVRWQGREATDTFARHQIQLFMSALGYQLPPAAIGVVHPRHHRN